MNKVIVTGRLTKDIELIYTKTGTAIGTTSIAVNEYYIDKNGEKVEDTNFFEIVFYNRYAEVANDMLSRGDKILIDGKLIQNKWVDSHGNNREKVKIKVDKFELVLRSKENQKRYESKFQNQKTDDYNVQDDHNEIPF
jgi:single-strand DNA-binding protein